MHRPRPSPVVLVLIGVVSVQFGAAFAKTLFSEIDPVTVVWLRLATSAAVLTAVARPRLAGHTRGDWAVMAGFGLSLATMNWAIYESFARLPLAVAVTIEFIGPLGLALLGSRRLRDLIWAALAAIGVVLLGATPTDLDPVGVALAVLAGLGWASYIVLSQQTGTRWSGLSGLSVASVVALLVISPVVLTRHVDQVTQLHVVVIGAAVGLLSSVIPYSCEMVALRSIRTSVFGILMSLEPAAAALAGLLVVHEVLSFTQVAAVACIVAASVGATRSAARSVKFTASPPIPDTRDTVPR